MTDTFRKHSRSLTAPPENAAPIQPSDGAELGYVTRAVYIGGAGALRVEMMGGEEIVFAGLAAGTLLPVRIQKVFATGTTATALVALW
jgi:hypothetical protein